jgi:phospholipid-binding lipoprotein MlaA
MISSSKFKIVLFVLLLSIFFLSGCSTLPKPGPNTEPAMRQQADLVPEGTTLDVEVYDPLEGFNRGTYRFNYYFDKYLFLPIVSIYQAIMPDYFEDRVSNFVDNVYEFNNFTNSLLQFKLNKTGITLSRFVINTTIGIAGLWDQATDMGLPRQPEDFGQTLGNYGVGHGPYIVLPIFGPSNLRDTTGLVTDSVAFKYAGPPAWVDDDTTTLVFTGVAAVDERKRTPFRYYGSGSPFEYEQIRLLYTKKRELDISE